MATVSVMPRQLLTADTSGDFVALQAKLDSLGYVTGSNQINMRTDDSANLTVIIDYPTWSLEV